MSTHADSAVVASSATSAHEFFRRLGLWFNEEVASYVVSCLINFSLLLSLALLGRLVQPRPVGEAPAFEVDLETELPESELTTFDIGTDPPIDALALDLDALLVPPAEIEMAESHGDRMAAGGSSDDNDGSAGQPGLDGQSGFVIPRTGGGPVVLGGPGKPTLTGWSGLRSPNWRGTMRCPSGVTRNSERTVAAALHWIARHQNADGSWSLDYQHVCADSSCTGHAQTASNPAATALALLPYLAAGQTHESKGPYQKTVTRGLEWLLKNQRTTGDFSDGQHQMYAHAIATIAMCEAYGMTKDSRLGLSAQAAVNFIVAGQDPQTGGWWYAHQQRGGDTSVVGWQMMALKSAQMAGLHVPPGAFDGVRTWLQSVAKGSYGGEFLYRPEGHGGPAMTAVGLLCWQYLGLRKDDPRMQEGVKYLLGRLPTDGPRNIYFVYYAAQVMHNLPGEDWDTWNRSMRRALIDTQCREGCAAGSWDPENPADAWGGHAGRLFVTSLATLSLEVYYRYLPLYQLDKPK